MNNENDISLDNLGFDEFFRSGWTNSGLSEYEPARVIAEYREVYRVRTETREYLAKVTGRQMYTAVSRADYPAVGDWVAITVLEPDNSLIRGILPRKSVLQKKYSGKQENQIIAVNIDCAFIVESMDRDYNLNRIERYLVLTEEGRITPVVILNKTDLISGSELDIRINEIKNRFNGIDIIKTSTVNGQGTGELEKYISAGKTYCFLGSSGVGKSSLINRMLGSDEIKTREVSLAMERGKHTTTAREMYFLKTGGLLIDNPGTREVGIGAATTGIENVFDQIRQLSQNCKFSDCSHTGEPGCAVLAAVNGNSLSPDKYNNYLNLKKEADFYKMTELEKREKDRKFGKYVKRVLKEIR